MNEERDSQLSAMFDGELPAAECELLARRLTRDDALRSQWSRYSLIGAALRAERGVALHDAVARRVQTQLAQEPTYGDGSGTGGIRPSVQVAASSSSSSRASRWTRIVRPAAGGTIAAGVAVMSIFWLRSQSVDEPIVARAAPAQSIVLAPEPATTVALNTAPNHAKPVSNGEPERYTTPSVSSQSTLSPPARLANYVVAHSEYSGPLSRRLALLGLVSAEGSAENAPLADPADAANGTENPNAP